MTLLKRRIGILKLSLVSTKSRLITYKTILFSKTSYAAGILAYNNENYLMKWEAILYRLLKSLLPIKDNVGKSILFETLGLEK
jgi:hypothetical protein